MKLIYIIILLLFSNLIYANELESSEVEVINLHETKSLDQMVLDNLNNENNINEVVESTTEDVVDEELTINTVEVESIEIFHKAKFLHKKRLIRTDMYPI